MNQLWIALIILGLIFLAINARAQTSENVRVRSGINHNEYDRLLKKYVNEQGLVNYGAWKQNTADLSGLDEYLHKDSFSAKRNEIGGHEVSLDDIEHGTLRPLIDYRAHAVLVCAARSCPPLQRFAYTANKFEEQDDRVYRAWLAREDLNRFLPNERKVEISGIFKWFKDDFEKAGGIPKILGHYAPEPVRAFAATGNYEIKYLPYNWGLNDQGPHGRNYSRAQFLLDNLFK